MWAELLEEGERERLGETLATFPWPPSNVFQSLLYVFLSVLCLFGTEEGLPFLQFETDVGLSPMEIYGFAIPFLTFPLESVAKVAPRPSITVAAS